MRLSGLHDWPCPPFGGIFMPGVFPGSRCAYSGYMTGLALLLEGFLCPAFSPDRGTCPGGGAMRLSGLHDVHMG